MSFGDAVEDELFKFGSFEQECYDVVVDILVFDELSVFVLGEFSEAVDVSNYWHHILDKDTDLVDDWGEFWRRNFDDLVVEMVVDGFEEASVGVLLEHAGPLEEKA